MFHGSLKAAELGEKRWLTVSGQQASRDLAGGHVLISPWVEVVFTRGVCLASTNTQTSIGSQIVIDFISVSIDIQ